MQINFFFGLYLEVFVQDYVFFGLNRVCFELEVVLVVFFIVQQIYQGYFVFVVRFVIIDLQRVFVVCWGGIQVLGFGVREFKKFLVVLIMSCLCWDFRFRVLSWFQFFVYNLIAMFCLRGFCDDLVRYLNRVLGIV